MPSPCPPRSVASVFECHLFGLYFILVLCLLSFHLCFVLSLISNSRFIFGLLRVQRLYLFRQQFGGLPFFILVVHDCLLCIVVCLGGGCNGSVILRLLCGVERL